MYLERTNPKSCYSGPRKMSPISPLSTIGRWAQFLLSPRLGVTWFSQTKQLFFVFAVINVRFYNFEILTSKVNFALFSLQNFCTFLHPEHVTWREEVCFGFLLFQQGHIVDLIRFLHMASSFRFLRTTKCRLRKTKRGHFYPVLSKIGSKC